MGMQFLVLLVILGEALGWTAPPSSRQYHIQTDEGPERYFRYQTDSGQYRKERRLADGTVVGSEGWVDASGYLRLKDYIADGGGYRILKSKTVFVGKGRPIDEAIKSAKSTPSQSGVLVGPRRPSYIPPSPSPTPYTPTSYIPPSSTPHTPTYIPPSSTSYLPPSPSSLYIPSSPSSTAKPVYITPRPPVPSNSLQPNYQSPSLEFLPPLGPYDQPQSVAPLGYVPPTKDYVPSRVVPLGQTGSTPRPFNTYFVPSTVRPITGYVSSSDNTVRVLTPSTAHPIPSYETSSPSSFGPSSVAPISGYGSTTPSPLSSYASSTANPISSYAPSSTARPPISSYGSTVSPISSYGSTVSPVSNYGSTVSPIASYGSTVSPIASYKSSTESPVSSYSISTQSYSPSSTVLPPHEDPYKYVSPEPQPFSLRYRDSNNLGDGYQRQYPTSDGVYTTKSGFRYFLPRLYHEEANSGEERIGSFGYVDPFGIRRVIYYNAGPGTGFRHRHNNRYVGLHGTPYDPRPL